MGGPEQGLDDGLLRGRGRGRGAAAGEEQAAAVRGLRAQLHGGGGGGGDGWRGLSGAPKPAPPACTAAELTRGPRGGGREGGVRLRLESKQTRQVQRGEEAGGRAAATRGPLSAFLPFFLLLLSPPRRRRRALLLFFQPSPLLLLLPGCRWGQRAAAPPRAPPPLFPSWRQTETTNQDAAFPLPVLDWQRRFTNQKRRWERGGKSARATHSAPLHPLSERGGADAKPDPTPFTPSGPRDREGGARGRGAPRSMLGVVVLSWPAAIALLSHSPLAFAKD